ncbi:hypothetical protein [Lentzea sp.]|uniref:hypothetical protein n=1 Tax=Lentzea sp. TaxID=56099 RepID=UPI002ED4D9A2
MSDSSTLDNDPGDGFKPGDPKSTPIADSPTVKDLLNPSQARPKSPEFLNVEAVANTTELRDQAVDALNRAAKGDSALTTPGTASRAQIDKMFSPENIKANLQRLIETGVQEQGLKYDRRVTDRSGAIGMSVKLGEAKLVSISDTTGSDNSVSGGYKAGESSTTSRSVDLTAGINIPVRPNVTPPPAGQPSNPSGSGGAAVTGKVTPWSDSKTQSNEIGGNVDRGRTTPGDARTVLVQVDAEFTIVGESRAGNFVHGGTPNAEGVTVSMPKSVFVRVSEDVAREMGVLPKVAPNVPKPDFPKMAPPSTVAPGEPGALGLSNVEKVPDLSAAVNELTTKLSQNTKKFGSDSLVPDSVLKDSMSNLQRIVDLNSPSSVKAMIDSALDGGVPLLVHQPGTFGKDSYQVTLRAKTGEPKFDQVVNDGVDMSHNDGGSRKEGDGKGRGTGWGVGLRAPGLASPGSANPNVSGTAGLSAGANVGSSTSSSVTTSTSEAFSHSRTASGPAARYNVPVEFELVVEKGTKEVAKATSVEQDMVVRTHADNQKVSQPTSGHGTQQPYMSAASKRGSEFGTPEATFAFQQDTRATQLPSTASVENLRGAGDLRDAAVKAMSEAGAGKGLTGKGTGSLNSLFSTLSPENLQPHLPSMLSGPLDVPGLKEAALTFGQDADVKVYAKLVNPQLGSLSDGVKIETPQTTKTTDVSSEGKVADTADVSVGLAQGSAAVKQGAPADTVNVGTGGVELRHANEDSSAVSGGPAQAEGGNVKPADASRTGLVQFDVEYRVVATIGGKTGVVDLTVPGSAGVRMPAAEVETMLNQQFSDSLKDAQTEVKKTADDWREAEKKVDEARHEAQEAINSSAAVLARTDQPLGDAATDLNTAIENHVNAEAELQARQTAFDNAVADVAATRATIQDLTPQIASLSQDALTANNALADAEINGAPKPELDRLGQEADAAHTALTDAQQQLADAHADLDAQRQAAIDARAQLQAQQQVVTDADAARATAEEKHNALADERAQAEQTIKDAETKLDDARKTADAEQKKWWEAKAEADHQVDAYNSSPPPVPPKPAPPTPPTPPPGDATTRTTADADAKPLPPTPQQPSGSTPEANQKPLPPLPAESSVAESSRGGVETGQPKASGSQNPSGSQSRPAPSAVTPGATPRSTAPTTDVPSAATSPVPGATPSPNLDDVAIPNVADTFVEDLFDELDATVETAPRPQQLLDGEWTSPQDASGPLTPQRLQDEFGMPRLNQARFQNLADRFNLVYDVRPTNADSVRWLEQGAVPKPKDIKAKTISPLDVHLGADPNTIGLVGFFEPRQPDWDSVPPEVRDSVRQRFENRTREFAELGPEMADLEAQGRYRVENGIVQADKSGEFKQITGDHDVYDIRRPDDGSSLSVEQNGDYDLNVWLLTQRNMGVQHGAHMYWEPQGAFQEKIFNDIVSRHQQTAPNAEPLIRFSPGQPPSLVFADPPPATTEPGTSSSRPAPADTDAPRQVRGGGAPPAMTPPTPESHRGKDVLTDESWRHDPAKTADWFVPEKPADRSSWADRRNDKDVRTVDVVVHDVKTDSTPRDIKSYQGLIGYDLRRIETSPGKFVQEYTVKVHVDPAANASPELVAQVKENARNGVNSLLNQGFRLPSGDQFHVNLEFTDNKADAHTSVRVDPDRKGIDQTHWNGDASPEVLAHETLHYLGVPDEYSDSSRVFQQHDTNSGVHKGDGGLMGADIHLPDPGVRPRHLWLVERTANSQVMVPDTRLEPAGPATVPPPAGWTPPAPSAETTADTADQSHDTARSDDTAAAQQNSAWTEPEVQTRPVHPTPNPVIPMTTLANPQVGQVMPGTQALPDFFQGNKGLGSIAPSDVRGAANVTAGIPNLKPADAARIQQAINGDFESFLDKGRNFQVKIGNTWYEANLRATMQAQTGVDPVAAPTTKTDMTAQSGNTSSTTHTVATANDVGGSVTASQGLGPYGSLGGKAQLATPGQSQVMSSSLTDQRIIRAGEGTTTATVGVTWDITLADANGGIRNLPPVSDGTSVTLHVPNDLATITGSGTGINADSVPVRNWGAKVEHPAPEVVTVDNPAKAFSDVSRNLHPSIVKIGSPGREALQNFLSPTEIRNNLGAMLGGAAVTSPDLVSPHASKGAAVQMTAKLFTAELVGTHDSSVLRLHDTAAHSSGVSSTTKSGGDLTGGLGFNAGLPNVVGGQVGATLGYSARVAENVNAGINTSHKSGIQIKGTTGLYKVRAEVEVASPSGAPVTIPVTTYLRLGLPEAAALGLPTPDGTRGSTVDDSGKGTKFAPPYLGDALATGNAKVGEFEVAAEVQAQVEGALRGLPGFDKFLPKWNNPDANPRSSKGQHFSDVAEQLANQRKLASQLSPAALRTNMDSLMGPGVQVQLKQSGATSNTYVNVTVKAKVTNTEHLGQADARNIRDASSTGPKLDSSTTTTKGWSAGVEGKVSIPAETKIAKMTPTPQLGAKYNHSWSDKTAAGPTVNSTSLNIGSPDAQVFRGDVEFEVEITTFTRPRAWVRRVTPGLPGHHVPEQHTVAKTGDGGLAPIRGGVNLWVSDSSTLDNDPGKGFEPGDPDVAELDNSPTVHELLTTPTATKAPEFLHVEAVANTTALRDQAIDALNRAAGGDSALTVPGTASRAQIDKMFSPENIKANLRTLTETGIAEQGLKYDRRVTDRSGAIGVKFGLSNPKIVSISDTTGTENATTGGYKAGSSSSTNRSVDVTGGVNLPIKPNNAPPPAGEPTPASGAGGVAVAGKYTPWADSKTSSKEIAGSHDRNRVTPSGARTVLVQLDADVTVVGESRSGNFVYGGTPRAQGASVSLPNSVFVRVTEDVARDMGLLPDVKPDVPKPALPSMAPPATVADGEPGALGLSTVESVPDLSGVVTDLAQRVNAATTKRFGGTLLPDSVLKDSMSNMQRLVDFSSPASVKAMVDSALDGGVPLLVHQPGTFGKDSYQVTLRAKTGDPKFQDVVNDGVEMESTIAGSTKAGEGQGRGTGWGLGLKAPGMAAPGSANPNVSGTAGVVAAANIGGSKSTSVTTTTTDQFGHLRAASGPAARYAVPIEFELVVEKGNKEIGRATSGLQEMTVRLHADNQKISEPTTSRGTPQPYMSAASKLPGRFGTAEATAEFQQDPRATQLPPHASVENFRGAKDLRDAAVKALTDAGAGKGLTGKGTGSLNSLLSTLSPETLQPHLPSMLSGPLDVPGLKEAALTFGQDAEVKVYARLVDPELGSLSDGVALENPKSQVTATSTDAKVSETGDVSVGLAAGSAAVKQGTDPKDTANFLPSGVELRHAGEDSSAVSGGPTDNKVNNTKPKVRTGLVQFGVEYRVVATVGGKTSVVDLSVPGSAGVRMPATDAQTLLGKDFGTDLDAAQTDLKKAADDWRTAEVTVDGRRHDAQKVINSAAASLAKNDAELRPLQERHEQAAGTHRTEQAKLPELETRADTAAREAAETQNAVNSLDSRIDGLSSNAVAAQLALDETRANGGDADTVRAAQIEADAARNALHRTQQQLRDAREQLRVDTEAAQARQAELEAQQRVVAEADTARAEAETAHNEKIARNAEDRAAQQALVEDAETQLDDARRAADGKQKDWWDQKSVVDRQITDYNNTPAPSTTTDTTSSSSSDTDSGHDAPPSGDVDRGEGPSTRPAPANPSDTGGDTSRSGDSTQDADNHSPAPVPDVVVRSHLQALAADAMQNAPQLARNVEAELIRPGAYLDHRAGRELLQLSVMLDTRTDEVAALIERHGVQAVADALNAQFSRPVIEREQFAAFGDFTTPEHRAAFDDWAHRMWATIGSTPTFANNPALLTDKVFDHEKGYNRATNFAQDQARLDMIGAPPLEETIADNPLTGSDVASQAEWTLRMLTTSEVLPENTVVSAEEFTRAAADNRAALQTGLGVELTDAKIAELKAALQALYVVDDDVTPPASPVETAAPATPWVTGATTEVTTPQQVTAPSTGTWVRPNAEPQARPQPAETPGAGSSTGPGTLRGDQTDAVQAQLRYLHEQVLGGPTPPPVTPNGLYTAIGQATGLDPDGLRRQVVTLAATHRAVTREVADWTADRPMHPNHLGGALVESHNWHLQTEAENTGAGNARDLVAHLIATQLSVNVRIHPPSGQPVLVRPMGPPFEETVDIDMVIAGRQVTYRPHQPLQQDQ